VHVVRHGLQFDDWGVALFANLADDLFEPIAHVVDKDRSPVLRAPHDVVGAAVHDVAV
jgi:hypothetical protein